MKNHSSLSKEDLSVRLQMLQPDAAPLWGQFTPQHMVEHLAEVIRFSNGKKSMDPAIPLEKAERAKLRMLSPEWVMPREFKAAFLPQEGLPDLVYSSLEAAKSALFTEIDDFYTFFAANPEATPNHPYFSLLNHSEWEVLHHKHISHHLEQFGI